MRVKINKYMHKMIDFFKEGKRSEKIKICVALLLLGVVFCITGKSIAGEKKGSSGKDERRENTISSLLTDGSSDEGKEITDNDSNSTLTDEDLKLEERLEGILSAINGVGRVEVLITYEDEGERIPMENTSEKSSQDTDDGISDNSSETDIIIENNGDGESVAVRRQTYPSVRGVIVVAEGASAAVLRSELISAVAAVTGVSHHKIRVMSM